MKILINSNRIHGSHLAKKIAEENKDIQVDLIGAPIIGDLPQNLNYIGDDIIFEDRLARIKETYKFYDFIYAADSAFQRSQNFQFWKNTISVPILSPSYECSYLEFSKIKLKKLMNEIGIPTPDYEILSPNDWGIVNEIKNKSLCTDKFLLKLDKTNVADGSQSMIATLDTYKNFIDRHAVAGHTGNFIVEKFIEGKEASVHFLCNGSGWIYLGAARDYKKINEGDTGPNCASTGCYSQVDYIEPVKEIIFSYVNKILQKLNENNIFYNGIMYLGVIIDKNNLPHILELNCRPGNPELCTILGTINSKNILENLICAAHGEKLKNVMFSNKSTVSISLVNKNYWKSIKSFGSENELSYKEDILITYFDKNFYFNRIYANILTTDATRESASLILFNYLSHQKLIHFRYRHDIGILE